MDKLYTVSGSKTMSFVTEFTHSDMVAAGYSCPKDYAHDLDEWERQHLREGDSFVEIWDVDEEEIDDE